MFKAKILLVGPCQAGKSVLANFLGDQTDILKSKYRPTVGVRILEFETSTGNGSDVEIELWDCSGSENYETCWPAMAYQADGVIIVYDPSNKNPTPSVEAFYNYFVASKGLKDTQCMIFTNCKGQDMDKITSPIPSVTAVTTDLEKDHGSITDDFKDFLKKVLTKMSAVQEREELDIIN
uniref:Rab-like protein 5 n=1 Tax=Ciona savignyi TaxID=51511 RepID=H2YA04_CIOSA